MDKSAAAVGDRHDDKEVGKDDTIAVEAGRMTRAAWLGSLALLLTFNASLEPLIITTLTKKIDDKLGPVSYYNWIMIGFNTANLFTYAITGRLSDIFGRQKFLIVGGIISIIACIVAMTANSMPTMVASMTLAGVGSGMSQLAIACIGEIVPRNHRGLAQAALDLSILPWTLFGNLMGQSMMKSRKLGYKICFIIGIILNLLSIVSILIWYRPEKRPLPFGRTKLQELARVDWTGLFLYAAGILLVLVPISSGGTDFPYTSPKFYLLITFGFLTLLALGFWEWKGAKEPFFPRSLFHNKSRKIALYLLLMFISGMSMYSTMGLWPQQAEGMFFEDVIKVGLSFLAVGGGFALGATIGGILLGRSWIFEARFILSSGSICKIVGDVLLATSTPETVARALVGVLLGCTGSGVLAVGSLTIVQLLCAEHDIGVASLLLQSLRGAGGSVALAIYSNYIQDAFQHQIVKIVIPFLGPYLPSIKDITAFFKTMIAGQFDKARLMFDDRPLGIKVVALTHERMGWVWGYAFRKVYFTSLGFAIIALFISLFADNVRHLMTTSVAVHMKGDHSTDDNAIRISPTSSIPTDQEKHSSDG